MLMVSIMRDLSMPNFTFFDHTADIGIEVSGRTKKRLFVNAAEAMFQIMLENKAGRHAKRHHRSIRVEGTDIADLLVNFLRELLYLFNGEKFIAMRCDIKTFADRALEASLTGELFDSKKHCIKMEIKAVTYSGAKVEKGKTGWKARIIFDV